MFVLHMLCSQNANRHMIAGEVEKRFQQKKRDNTTEDENVVWREYGFATEPMLPKQHLEVNNLH